MQLKNIFAPLKTLSMRWGLFLTLLVVSSCAHMLSQNYVYEGRWTVKGMRVGKEEKSLKLHFWRVSWQQELTMHADLLFHPLTPKSPLYSQLPFAKTGHCFLLLEYRMDLGAMKKVDFSEIISAQGHEEHEVSFLQNDFSQHPVFKRHGMRDYKVKSFCHKERRSLTFKFPTYRPVVVTL